MKRAKGFFVVDILLDLLFLSTLGCLLLAVKWSFVLKLEIGDDLVIMIGP